MCITWHYWYYVMCVLSSFTLYCITLCYILYVCVYVCMQLVGANSDLFNGNIWRERERKRERRDFINDNHKWKVRGKTFNCILCLSFFSILSLLPFHLSPFPTSLSLSFFLSISFSLNILSLSVNAICNIFRYLVRIPYEKHYTL